MSGFNSAGFNSQPALKVVLHVSDPMHLQHALSNAANLRKANANAQIRLIFNGLAVTCVQGDNKLTQRLRETAEHDVQVQVCRNGLRAHDIDEATLPDFVTVVPAAIVALAEAQAEGFAYVKP